MSGKNGSAVCSGGTLTRNKPIKPLTWDSVHVSLGSWTYKYAVVWCGMHFKSFICIEFFSRNLLRMAKFSA